jgi:hypothetical protein
MTLTEQIAAARARQVAIQLESKVRRADRALDLDSHEVSELVEVK